MQREENLRLLEERSHLNTRLGPIEEEITRSNLDKQKSEQHAELLGKLASGGDSEAQYKLAETLYER